MDDTPQHIKDLQLKIWLSKPSGDRLLQSITDNEALYLAWKKAKEAQQKILLKVLGDSNISL